MIENLTNKIFPHIEENYESGKKILIDSKGNKFECNLFGKKITKFHRNITGKANYSCRLNSNLIEKISNDFDDKIYRPQGIFFDGYFQFPNPKVSPFQNVIKDNSLIIKELKKNPRISLNKNKELLNINNNHSLSYLTSTIYIRDSRYKIPIFKLIDNEIKENEKIKKQKLSVSNYLNSEINELKKFKKKLIENNSDRIYGIKLKTPNNFIKEKFNLYHNVFFLNPYKKKIINVKCNNKSMDNIRLLNDNSLNKNFDKNNQIEEKKIKSFREFINKCKYDNKFIEGYKKEKVKLKGTFQKYVPNFISMKEIYRKELELRKKVDPEGCKREEERIMKDRIFFLKQKQNEKLLDRLRKKILFKNK